MVTTSRSQFDRCGVSSAERAFQEFLDAIQTASDEAAFERIARRVTERLGFRWFAYLRLTENAPMLISSYPKSWTKRYFELGYQNLDPVVRRARQQHEVFCWNGEGSAAAGTRQQRRFFEEATTFGITSGVTMPIRGGFGRTAAFTLATDDRAMRPEKLVGESRDVLHLLGLYFHTHVTTRLDAGRLAATAGASDLSPRERQCLAWAALGKTVADIAVLTEIAPRTVTFHLGNARRKLNAASITQCAAEAVRRGLLP